MTDNIRIIRGENSAILEELHAAGERFALAYLDPPFCTQRDYFTISGAFAFSDKWRDRKHYLLELGQRLELARTLLLDEGCLVLHLDPTIVHYAKVLCDEVFGVACYAGEIIWRYRRWPTKTRNFQAMHDVLLRYVRDPHAEHRFNQLHEPLSASTLATWGGRRQVALFKDTPSGPRRSRSSKSNRPSPGAPLSDVWDVPILAPSASERTGYPTQKPEALIARLVDALTNVGDAVLDAYMGSGTVPAVCAARERKCVAIDQSEVAVRIATERLKRVQHEQPLFAARG